jgi:pSer/pThr/pTyr-binding forkhead associated (FHA) protein
LTESSIDNKNRWRRLLYQDFRFNKYTNKNTCTIIQNDDKKLEFHEPIISIGRNENNNYCIDELSVSRRHCVIVNYPNDVWIYDLGSKCGIYIDDQKVNGKQFLLGKHRIKVGSFEFDFYSSEGIFI